MPPPIKVLLVEDNPADADLIREALTDVREAAMPGAPDFELVHVDRLARAEAVLAEGDIGVVLLDLSLPDSQGFESFGRLTERSPGMPIVVLTGLADMDLGIRAFREGVQDYLVKGFVDGPTLVRSLRYAIERKAAEVERSRLLREQAAAEAALRARDEVLAAISHDLRTPLSSIRMLAQLLARWVVGKHPPAADELAERLRQIATLTAQMAGMIDELLDVTRLEAGRPLELGRAPVDLVALTRQAIADAQRSTERHVVSFDCSVPELVGTWDARRLERVLANLLGNAIKYSPAGGEVVVTVDRQAVPLGADWAVLRVHDGGIGIPAADLPKLFEQYFRASNVVGRIPGSGIGLAGASQIVAQHGGTIEVESQEGHGSTFTVRLPLIPPDRLLAEAGGPIGTTTS